MCERPNPSDCPLCGGKCENSTDPDCYETVTCTRVDSNGHFCPYHVYADCHEPICAKIKEKKP